ncbi:MAG: HD domain-containing protein [Kiritimatiellae bacterium]|nr:HD domain-containing protein [Kiritimatiellia bacterium]
MTNDFLERLEGLYNGYVDSFRDADGALPEMLGLKLRHTRGVVDDAALIMAGEGWAAGSCVLGRACALLHDTGRYSQWQEFGTFQDSRSVDHARRGVEVITREGWLTALMASERKAAIVSVALHNRRVLPVGLDAATTAFAHLVRDADKLDIFRVFEAAVADGMLERNPEMTWGLRMDGPPAQDVLRAVAAGHTVDYAQVKSLADFILIQIGWLSGGLHYRAALRLAAVRKALEFREDFLLKLCGKDAVKECCDDVRVRLSKRLNETEAT